MSGKLNKLQKSKKMIESGIIVCLISIKTYEKPFQKSRIKNIEILKQTKYDKQGTLNQKF